MWQVLHFKAACNNIYRHKYSMLLLSKRLVVMQTQTAMLETSLNTLHLSYTKLPTQGIPNIQTCFQERLVISENKCDWTPYLSFFNLHMWTDSITAFITNSVYHALHSHHIHQILSMSKLLHKYETCLILHPPCKPFLC